MPSGSSFILISGSNAPYLVANRGENTTKLLKLVHIISYLVSGSISEILIRSLMLVLTQSCVQLPVL